MSRLHKFALVVACVLALPWRVEAAAAYVQFASGTANLATSVVTGTGGTAFPGNVTNTNTIAVAARWANQSRTMAITDSCGNSYADSGLGQINAVGGNGALQFFHAYNVTGGSSCVVTGTLTGGGSFELGIIAAEISGVPTTDPIDVGVNASVNNDTGTDIATAAVTPSANGAVVFAASTVANADGTYTAVAPFTEITEAGAWPTQSALQAEYYNQAAAASVTPAWTLSTTNSAMAGAVVFKASGGGGGSTCNGGLLTMGAGKACEH